jgi:hypothetical protein
MSASVMLFYYLWIAPHVLEGIVLYAMVRRGLHRQFPMFFLYISFEIAQCSCLLAVSRYVSYFGQVYIQVYAVGLAVSTAVRFAVIYELFCHFFRRYPAISGAGKLLFRGASLALLLIALGLAVSAPGNTPAASLSDATYVALRTTTFAADRAVSILQGGLLISLFLFSRYFVLSWRSPAFGIALGMGTFAIAEFATTALRLYVPISNKVFDRSAMGIYHLCVLIWILYVVRPEPEFRFELKSLPTYDLEIWNQELERLLQQ